MKTMRTWKIVAMVGMILVLTATGQVHGDFRFGEPVNLGFAINSSNPEYDPSISADGLELYFQSTRAGGYGDRDIYVATRATTDDQWSQAVNLGPIINTSARDAGPDISSDGLSLYFNSNRAGGSGNYDLYVTTRKTLHDPWTEPVNLGPGLNTSADEISSTISADGLSLFFSDGDALGTTARANGYGGADIWTTQRISQYNEWETPVNLGPLINIPFVAGAPEISPDGLSLFFSGYCPSDGGTHDLWIARRDTLDAPWNTPVNLGPSVNSDSDADLNPTISADGRMLYFASFRSGGKGNSDIWQVPIEPILDFNSDGIIDSDDLCIMADNWRQNESLCDIGPTPFGDGIVDDHDLAVLVEHLFEETLPLELLAYWKLDEAEGNIAYDLTGRYDAILNGNPQWQLAEGKAGALQLDGIHNYLSTDFVLNPAYGQFSICAWIKGGAPGQVILAQRNGVNWLSTDPSEGCLMTELKGLTRTARPLLSQTVITDGNWHHISIVWDGLLRTLYIDGINVAQDEQKNLDSMQSGLYIGAGKTLDAESFFSGLIDDVRIYDVAMSTEQIKAMAR